MSTHVIMVYADGSEAPLSVLETYRDGRRDGDLVVRVAAPPIAPAENPGNPHEYDCPMNAHHRHDVDLAETLPPERCTCGARKFL